MGSLRLETSDVTCQSCLLVEAEPTAEVEEQPLDLELGQLEGRPQVEAEGDGPDAGQEIESGETFRQLDGLAPHPEPESPRIETAGDDGQERRERDLLLPLGLGDALELSAQSRLSVERQIDRLRECQWLAAGGDRIEGGLVGITRK